MFIGRAESIFTHIGIILLVLWDLEELLRVERTISKSLYIIDCHDNILLRLLLQTHQISIIGVYRTQLLQKLLVDSILLFDNVLFIPFFNVSPFYEFVVDIVGCLPRMRDNLEAVLDLLRTYPKIIAFSRIEGFPCPQMLRFFQECESCVLMGNKQLAKELILFLRLSEFLIDDQQPCELP